VKRMVPAVPKIGCVQHDCAACQQDKRAFMLQYVLNRALSGGTCGISAAIEAGKAWAKIQETSK
jgi:hypothetical protein